MYTINPSDVPYFETLFALRDTGVTNMLDSASYLQKNHSLDKHKAESILLEWMTHCSQIEPSIKTSKVMGTIADDDELLFSDDEVEVVPQQLAKTPSEYSQTWDDSTSYEKGTRIVHKSRVYEAKHSTRGHPTSKQDWTLLPRNIAVAKKAEKVKKGKIEKATVKKTKKVAKGSLLEEALLRIESLCQRLDKFERAL